MFVLLGHWVSLSVGRSVGGWAAHWLAIFVVSLFVHSCVRLSVHFCVCLFFSLLPVFIRALVELQSFVLKSRNSTYVRTHVHTYVRTYVRTYIRTHIRTYVRTYVHTYIHTYVHTHIHTYKCILTVGTYTPRHIRAYLPTYLAT